MNMEIFRVISYEEMNPETKKKKKKNTKENVAGKCEKKIRNYAI